MAGETTLTYNGVPLSYIETASVHSEAVKDPSGMDHIYNRHTIEVVAMMTFTKFGAGLPPALPGETPAQTMVRVGHMLAVPRRPFVYAVDGKVLFQSDGLDPAGGPNPVGQPAITKITPQSFQVKYALEFCENDCPEKGAKPLWLSIRWTQEQDIDELNYSTIVTTGRAIFGADVLKKLGGADQLRGLVVPPVPNNFIRKSHYVIQENGLQIDFSHVDQEQYIMPPEDAGKISGSFTHRFIKGGLWFSNVHLKLEGRKNTPKARLMATAVSIAFKRLKAADPNAGKGGNQPLFVMDGKFTEQFEKNVVDVELSGRTNAPHVSTGVMTKFDPTAAAAGALIGSVLPGVGIVGGAILGDAITDAIKKQRADAKLMAAANQAGNAGLLALNLQQWGTPLLGCPGPDDASAGIQPSLRGNFPQLRLLAAAFRDPCLTSTLDLAKMSFEFDGTKQEPAMTTPTGDRPSLSNRPPYPASSNVSTMSGLPPLTTSTLRSISDPYQGVYETYIIECHYNRKENCAVLPATVSGQAGKKVQWANPEIKLRCTWTATKWGTPPTIPDPSPKDTNTVLINSGVMIDNSELTPDGAHLLYSFTGEYQYEFLDTSKVNVSIPVAPFLGLTSSMLTGPPMGDAGIFPSAGTSSLVSR
jgi:hypothetical protein